jgi:molybdopterin converting factor subunit 1
MASRSAGNSDDAASGPGEGSVRVRIVAFARARELLGRAEVDLDLPVGSTVGHCLAALRREHPRLGGIADSLLMAVNEEYVDRSRPLAAGDTVALIPPVSGG